MQKYMMATKAIHKLGDISREPADLCTITDEDEENYIGMWVTGFGFFDVKFPKETTKELTKDEIEQYNGKQISVNGGYRYTLKIKDNTTPLISTQAKRDP